MLALRGFDEDKCMLWASALTFYTLMSIVPLLAMAFGIAKGFGLHERLEKELLEKFTSQHGVAQELVTQDSTLTISDQLPEMSQDVMQEVIRKIIEFANTMLDQTKGGLIAGIGIIVLMYLIFKLLRNIERSFNDIWGVTHSRPIGRQLTDYLSVLFVAPILFILSSSLIVFVKTRVEDIAQIITQKVSLVGHITPLITFSLNFFSLFAGWLLFNFIYTFMPNTKVRFRSGLLGGVIAGTISVIIQGIYITFQVGVSRYNAIYGSFAGLPLFMLWLQTFWMVVLFGAELSFAHQNVNTYEFETDSLTASNRIRRILSLRIANLCVKNFIAGEKPWNADKISEFLDIPIRLIHRLLDDLVQGRILSEAIGENEKSPCYQPARDINALTINYVIQRLDEVGSNEIIAEDSREINKIKKTMDEFSKIIDNSSANLTLSNI